VITLDELGLFPCPYCGGDGPEVADADVESDARIAVMFDACCEAMCSVAQAIAESGAGDFRDLLEACGYQDLVYAPTSMRRVVEEGGGYLADRRIRVAPIPWAQAREFVQAYHRHTRPPAGWLFGFGAWNGEVLIGVVVVGRPVARRLDDGRVAEVTRLCVLPDSPLVLHACSQLYAAAAREAARRGYSRIVSYTLASEQGTSLRAAGWSIESESQGGEWSRRGRKRPAAVAPGRKVRWGLVLRPKVPRAPRAAQDDSAA
jgi:hypothetical protein